MKYNRSSSADLKAETPGRIKSFVLSAVRVHGNSEKVKPNIINVPKN
jgi:hypothetical protein